MIYVSHVYPGILASFFYPFAIDFSFLGRATFCPLPCTIRHCSVGCLNRKLRPPSRWDSGLYNRRSDSLSPIHISSVTDNSDNNLSRSLVSEVEDSIIAQANAPAIAIFEFFATGRKRIVFKSQESAGDALLHGNGQPGQLLPCPATHLNAPAHTRIRRCFSTSRSGE